MIVILYIIVIIVLLYASLIGVFTRAWLSQKPFSCEKNQEKSLIFSLLIPFRNEESNLKYLIKDLEKQVYPLKNFQLVFIDDESADESTKVVENALAESPIKHIILKSMGGKKKAVETGLIHASGDYIISLDADVRIGPDLIRCYNKYFQQYKPKLIAGPVSFEYSSSFLSKLLSLEFMSLIASAAGAIGLGKPMMLNAANMGFERSVALEFKKQVYESEMASGDDQFLMEAIEQKYGASSISFMKSPQAIATTTAPSSLSAFFNQRIRWASKTSSYTSRFSQMVAVLVFLFNLGVLASFVYSVIQQCAIPFLMAYGIKALIDLPILLSASIFFKQKRLMIYYPLVQFLYPWYIVIVAIWSLIGGYSWKGRRY